MWQPIDTAPKDGRTVRVRRTYEGRTVYDGPAAWRRFTAGALYDPFTGKMFAEPADKMAWMYPAGHPEQQYCVPVPTEWHPGDQIADNPLRG